MARYTYFRNLNDSAAEEESFDVTVDVDADVGTVTGPDVLKLFEALQTWGPGAANARFNVGLGNSTLENWAFVSRDSETPGSDALRIQQCED